MSPKDAMKNKLPISEMKDIILEFCKSQPNMEVAIKSETDFPIIEKGNYKYINGKHILLLVRASRLLNKVNDGDLIAGMIFDKDGEGLKSSRRIYGNYKVKEIDTTNEWLIDAVKADKMYTKMLNHGAKFFELELIEGTVYFSGSDIFELDREYNPSFAQYTPAGVERFENSYKIVMEYLDREVIFNVFVENGVYYTLTSASSNKVEYLKNGGTCKIYDGRDNQFECVIEILAEDKVAEIDAKLKATNNAFFHNLDNLLALSFRK